MKKFEHYDLLKEMVAKKYVSVQKHPTLPLYIYKYSISTPFEKMWNHATMNARGLVLDENGMQYNTPFEKFFNVEELTQVGLMLPYNISYDVYKKVDGSLIQAFFYNDKLIYTSSGSLNSIFSKVGKEIAIEKGYDKLMYQYRKKLLNDNVVIDGLTFIFELLHPDNKIVINNGNIRDLILLSVRNYNKSVTIDHILNQETLGNFNIIEKVNMTFDELIKEKFRPDFINEEGFVVVYDNGFRVKIKYEEYFRLHKTISNVNERFVWEFLSTGKDINELGDNIPDETFQSIKDMKKELEDQFNSIDFQAKEIYATILNHFKDTIELDKKTFAIYIDTPALKKFKGILFRIYDGRSYDDIIWKMIRPKYKKGEGGFQSFKLENNNVL